MFQLDYKNAIVLNCIFIENLSLYSKNKFLQDYPTLYFMFIFRKNNNICKVNQIALYDKISEIWSITVKII